MLSGELVIEAMGYTVLASGRIPGQILRGELDFLFLKPMRTGFLILFQQVFFYSIPSIALRAFLLVIVFIVSGISLTPLQTSYVLFVLISSLGIVSLLFAFFLGLCFYVENLASAREFLHGLIQDTTRYPKEIYPFFWQTIGVYLIPIFLVGNPMFKVLHSEYTIIDLLTTLIIVSILSIVINLLWKEGLKRYISAN